MFQLEKGNGEHFEMGLSELKASLPEISQKGALFLEEQLRVHLKRQEIDVKTLAVPEAILATHGKWHLQMGQETPLTLEGKDHHMSTSWHFSGLKIDVELLPVGEGIRVDYKVELTSPVGSQVHGNKESASLFVKEGELLPLFQLAYENQSEEAAHFPLLHYLPLIGSLFRSLDHREAYKKICGFLVIDHEEINANPSLTSLPSLSTP